MKMTRTAIVTGGTRGIGAAISVGLKEAGHQVAAIYAGNDEAAAVFKAETGISVFKWDVGDFAACAQGIAAVEGELGPVDVLVNNAGITRDTMLHKMDEETWREVMRVDLDSVFNMCRHVIEGMRSRGFGRIVNITSINGQKGQMGQTNYSAAKAGMIGFTKALAQETARKGITVNCVAPGYIDTEMVRSVPAEVLDKIIAGIPVGRLGTAEEMAHCVTFLADEKSGFITGSTMTANGAQYITG
jgi:acetoacetyl-CoA reductase